MNRILPLLAATLPAAGALCQSTLETTPAAFERIPIHSAEPDQGHDYGLWAAGRTYKASFHGAVTFVPYLGADYPHNQPFAWTTTSIARGGIELAGGDAQRWHDDFHFELRGRGCVEAYDVRPDGLEQTFVFDCAPRGQGDLVIRGALDTMLRADAVRDWHGPLRFSDDRGQAILTYGQGTVLDADGRAGPVYTSYEDGELSLRVPAAWLENARYPVVVDPLISTDGSAQSVSVESSDIADADGTTRLLHVYSIAASLLDLDVIGDVVDAGLTSRTNVYADITTSWSTPRAQCATAGDPQRFGISLDRELPSRYLVRVHIRDALSNAFATNVVFLTPPSSSDNDWRSDIGGVDVTSGPFTSTGTEFMVVWQRDAGATPTNTNVSTIWGRTVDVNGTVGAEKGIAIGAFNPPDYERPSIVKQTVPTGTVTNNRVTWAVAYQNSPNGSSHWNVSISHVDDSSSGGAQRGITLGTSVTQLLNPQISGRPGRYYVAYGFSTVFQLPFKSVLTLAHGIRATRIDWPVGGTASQPHLEHSLASSGDRNWEVGGTAFDTESRSHWIVTYSQTNFLGGSGRTWADRVGYRGRVVESLRVHQPTFLQGSSLPGGCAFTRFGDEFFASWCGNAPSGGTAWAGRIGPVVVNNLTSGSSCSPATIEWRGTSRIGSEFSGVGLSGAPGGQLAWLLISVGSANQGLASFGFPGCRLLVDNQAPNFVGLDVQITDAGGAAFSPLPLPESLTDVNAYFQWFHLDGPSGSPTLQSTQRLLVQMRR